MTKCQALFLDYSLINEKLNKYCDRINELSRESPLSAKNGFYLEIISAYGETGFTKSTLEKNRYMLFGTKSDREVNFAYTQKEGRAEVTSDWQDDGELVGSISIKP